MPESNTFALAIKIIATTFGVLGGGFLGNLLAPWVVKSRRGQSGILISGAAVGGLIMWMAISHTGGSGFGLGGGHSSSSGQGAGDGATQKDVKDHKDTKAESDKDKTTKPGDMTASVTILGGERVKEQRFYVLNGDRPRNLKEMEEALQEKKKKNASLGELEIVLYNDSVPRDSEAVANLEDWARGHGFTTKLKLMDKPMP